MIKLISSISYLDDGVRSHVGSTSDGRFKLPRTYIRARPRASKNRKYDLFTATGFVSHRVVRTGDPVLTLNNGDKIRVFQGGDMSQMTVTAHSYIEQHDNEMSDTTDEWPIPPLIPDYPGW